MSQQQTFILEVSQNSFNTQVLLPSHRVPVLVHFMVVYSEPCIQLEERLLPLAREFDGQLICARVDVDEQMALRQEYGIENLPTLKLFKDGQVVLTEEGVMQEDELRDLLKSVGIYRQSDELREQARRKHMQGDTVAAVQLLTQAIQQDPGNTRVAMDMVQVMLDIDQLESATALFNKLPDREKESEFGKMLVGQITFKQLAAKTEGITALEERLAADASDLDAHFDLALCQVAIHNPREALDHLFTVFAAEPDYKEGAVREMIIVLANMLAPNDPQLAQEARRRLGSAVS